MTIDQQLEKLRTEYRKAKKENNTEKMRLIARIAESLKDQPTDYFSHQVKQSLGINATSSQSPT